VWFDRTCVPRIVRKPAWRTLVDEMEAEPLDPEANDPALSDDPAEIEDRAQVFHVLERGAAVGVDGVNAALARATERGAALAPLELVDGELRLSFDPIETLRAQVSNATPLAQGDDALTAALAAAQTFLNTQDAASAPSVAEGLAAKVRDALAKKKGRSEFVNEQVERALVEQRHYLKRKVLGGPQLRGLLHVMGETRSLVVYVPASIADELPLATRFRARVITAVHPAVDEQETEPVALHAVALGRLVHVAQSA
jgi:hypothetical protein